ncbi:TPA: pyridine nucleotide-disulfide oxidoreductase [Klebsiella pneumoniae]|nr:pyridine nucleotide-disulfide oxidoreductase [Klebsiella pneumoniae]PLI16584.1 pyridine nucleotide-disulfide oxidoreductase [Klebsiella pneumoniae]PLI21027.1 pyridine nucleotide-disulfide oxidoreductase [Klebsiella pneumoniae]HBX3181813.1 pyridine nucleotide-disulfide oxidoreductase [Klebsiella pneumoniae]HBY4081647.1 pyridine nucleotide-disulfide oxidoreductase [Klebsiella pneumoniae]
MKGARLIARPSVHNALFETADGGGVVYWQKLILCCSAGSASPRPSSAPSGWRSR